GRPRYSDRRRVQCRQKMASGVPTQADTLIGNAENRTLSRNPGVATDSPEPRAPTAYQARRFDSQDESQSSPFPRMRSNGGAEMPCNRRVGYRELQRTTSGPDCGGFF